MDRYGHVDVHATGGIHDVTDPLKTDQQVPIDAHSQNTAYGSPGRFRAAQRVSSVDALLAETGDRYPQVTRDRDQHDPGRRAVGDDRQQRIGSPRITSAELVRACVAAEHEERHPSRHQQPETCRGNQGQGQYAEKHAPDASACPAPRVFKRGRGRGSRSSPCAARLRLGLDRQNFTAWDIWLARGSAPRHDRGHRLSGRARDAAISKLGQPNPQNIAITQGAEHPRRKREAVHSDPVGTPQVSHASTAVMLHDLGVDLGHVLVPQHNLIAAPSPDPYGRDLQHALSLRRSWSTNNQPFPAAASHTPVPRPVSDASSPRGTKACSRRRRAGPRG